MPEWHVANWAPQRYSLPMTAIARQLDETLRRLDAQAAAALEKLVRDALELAVSGNGVSATAAPGSLPSDFFTKVAQEFGSEPLERLPQGEFEKRDNW